MASIEATSRSSAVRSAGEWCVVFMVFHGFSIPFFVVFHVSWCRKGGQLRRLRMSTLQ